LTSYQCVLHTCGYILLLARSRSSLIPLYCVPLPPSELVEAIICTLFFVGVFPAACRHDLIIQQGGAQTNTTLRHFLLCGAGQVHDLHSSMVLEHPEGTTDQLHKCIVSDATGHGIFDGNVQVMHPCFIASPCTISHDAACTHGRNRASSRSYR
jgi:hypothetical protein